MLEIFLPPYTISPFTYLDPFSVDWLVHIYILEHFRLLNLFLVYMRLSDCSVCLFQGLVAIENVYPGEPVIEYRGFCMLLTEYNETCDYRKQ